MISKQKIRIMTDLARYDKKNGKKNRIIGSYFKADYVGRYMVGSFISYSFCYLLVMAISVLCRIEEIMGETDITVIFRMIKPYAVFYAAGLVIYEVIVIPVYAFRFEAGKRQLKANTAKLRRLNKLQ